MIIIKLLLKGCCCILFRIIQNTKLCQVASLRVFSVLELLNDATDEFPWWAVRILGAVVNGVGLPSDLGAVTNLGLWNIRLANNGWPLQSIQCKITLRPSFGRQTVTAGSFQYFIGKKCVYVKPGCVWWWRRPPCAPWGPSGRPGATC